jgi:hypothetical protein
MFFKKISLLLLSFLVVGTTYAQKLAKAQKPVYFKNTNIDIVYVDKVGNDLLDSGNTVHFSAKDITVYNIEKGEKVKVNKPKMDYPNNHFIFRDEATGKNHLRVFLEAETVLLQLNTTTTDTIKCKIKKAKGSTHITKVWYNGKLVWQFGKDVSQVITITR